MKSLVLHSEAQAEFDAAVAYYESKRKGLGRDFIAEVKKVFQKIKRNPKAFSRFPDTDFRKALVMRFPYLVFFRELGKIIWIVAISHAKRKPGYWMDRSE